MSYATEVLADTPVAYWRFEDNANDETGNGYDGTVNGATYVDGLEGRALDFDGVDDYFDAGLLGTFGQSLGSCSVEFILTTTTTANGDAIFGQEQDTSTGQFFSVRVNESRSGAATADAMALFLRDESGVSLRAQIDEPTLYDGTAHHVVWTIDTTDPVVRVYIDGTEVSVSDNNQTPSNFASFDALLAIGATGNVGTPDGFVDATIDEFALYDKVLSSARVQDHYDAIGTTETQQLDVPTNWTFVKTDATAEVVGSWDAVTDAETYDYEVEEKDDEGSWQPFALGSTTDPTTSFTLTSSDGVKFDTEYRARVRAVPAV